MLNVIAIPPQGHKTIIQALTENSEEHLDENGFPTQRFLKLVQVLKGMDFWILLKHIIVGFLEFRLFEKLSTFEFWF